MDLRALQSEFLEGLHKIVSEEMESFAYFLQGDEKSKLTSKIYKAMHDAHDSTSTMDAQARMQKIAASSTIILLEYLTGAAFNRPEAAGLALTAIPDFRSRVATRANVLLDVLRQEYLSGERGPAPASKYLNRTRPVYEYVRNELGIRMHGSENYSRFENGLGVDDVTIGQNISLIHEAIRDGKIQSVIVNLF